MLGVSPPSPFLGPGTAGNQLGSNPLPPLICPPTHTPFSRNLTTKTTSLHLSSPSLVEGDMLAGAEN